MSKEWIEDTTLQDLIYVVDYLGIDPLFNVALPIKEEKVPDIKVEIKTTQISDDKKQIDKYIYTPYGVLRSRSISQKFHGVTPVKLWWKPNRI